MRFGLVTWFIDHLYTHFVATSNYNALTGLHTLKITVTAHKVFYVISSRFLVTDLKLVPLIAPCHGLHRRHRSLLYFNCLCGKSLFVKLLLSNGCRIFAYSVIVAQQQVYMVQYCCNVQQSWKWIIQTESWGKIETKDSCWMFKETVTAYVPYLPVYAGDCWDST
jgi:hypothetical protein